MTVSGGDYPRIDPAFNDWSGIVCESSPTKLLRPFYFTFSGSTNTSTIITASYTNAAYCPWPISNSAFRLTAGCLSFVLLITLCYPTILSDIARTIFLSFALLYFSCFVLDVNQTLSGFYTCHENFYGTSLGQSIVKHHVTIACSSAPQAAIILFDFFISFFLYLLFECWGMCKDIYDVKEDASTKVRDSGGSQETQNPIHRSNVSTPSRSAAKSTPKKTPLSNIKHSPTEDYSPYERGGDVDYSPYEPSTDHHIYEPYEHVDPHSYAPYEPQGRTIPVTKSALSTTRTTPIKTRI